MDDADYAYLESLERELQTSTNNQIVPAGQRPCPICRQHMPVESQHGIQLDVCEEHGIWLDRNELAIIVGRIKVGERIKRADAVQEARRSGKLSGTFLGVWSLLLD